MMRWFNLVRAPTRSQAAFLSLLVCIGLSAHGPSEANSSSAIEAIWRKQTMDFVYSSETQHLTCAELRSKLSAILHAVGAHREMAVAALCPEGVSGRIRATITLAAPVAATHDNVVAATTFSETERLLAHVTGKPLPTLDSLDRFPALWRTVSFKRDRAVGLANADCDLLHAVSKQVFPHLSVRVTRALPRCMHPQIRPRLVVEALVPEQPPDRTSGF